MSGQRIFVSKKSSFDIVSKKYLEDFNTSFHCDLKNLKVYKIYDLYNVSNDNLKLIVNNVLMETVTDEVCYSLDLVDKSYIASELLPGQFDIRSYNGKKCAELICSLDKDFVMECGEIIVFEEKLKEELLSKIKKYIINPAEKREKNITKLEKNITPKTTEILDTSNFKDMTQEEILNVCTLLGINLDLNTLLYIQKYYKDNNYTCNSTELYLFDTYWSDHCRHTTFSTILDKVTYDNSSISTYIKKSYQKYLKQKEEIKCKKPITLMDIATFNSRYLKKQGKLNNLEESEEINACSIFTQVDGQPYLVMFKNETHNHPTEIEPFGGASTCLGGAIRDPLSGRSYVYQGIRISGAADPTIDLQYTMDKKLPQSKICKLSALGFASYGNQIGMATTMVKEYYHPSYVAKRLELGAVMAATPAKNVIRKSPKPDDLIILLGGKTGKDGIGGASGSSLSHTEKSLDNSLSQIQKGNPLEERKLQRLFKNEKFATMVKKCNDFGAGGVSVAIGELADGVEVNLDKVPLKTENINYSQIAISESQERMAIVIDKKDLDKIYELALVENVEATLVGKVTEEKKLVMKYKDKVVATIDRNFLDTNGITYKQNVYVKTKEYKSYNREHYKKLNLYSQKGLSEIFDNSVGCGTVLASYGGGNQITTQLGSVQLIHTHKPTSKATVVTAGFDPTLSEKSPYLTGLYAVIEAVAKQIALGGTLEDIYISMQEFFPSLKGDDEKWGLVFSALLGAYEAMDNLQLGAIGGKDSMSGSFEDIDVISTIVAFAFTVTDTCKIISRELKEDNSNIYFVPLTVDENNYPDFHQLKNNFEKIQSNTNKFLSISTVDIGIKETLLNMGYGNDIDVVLSTDFNIEEKYYGSFIVETKEEITEEGFYKIGTTTKNIKEDFLENKKEHLQGLYNVYPFVNTKLSDNTIEQNSLSTKKYFPTKIEKPNVLILCFSGTNSEMDMDRSFSMAGGNCEVLVLDPNGSIDTVVKKLKDTHILVFPGGFSYSDEPDGSGKYIANFLKNKNIKESVEKFLSEKKLILGICNGFQGLIKSGLLPYGKVIHREDSPTLFYNDNFRHISKIVATKVVNNTSPWLQDVDTNIEYMLPISHGEGKFVASYKVLEKIINNGQVATTYSRENPNGSTYNIEGITSPDGLILGKMAHNERSRNDLFINIDGEKFQDIFTSSINYFTHNKTIK